MEHLTLIDYISVGWVSIGLILTVIAIIRDSRIQKKIQNSIYNHYQNNDMDYEQKYKEALKKARDLSALPTDKAMLEEIFPELKESEDERIRKEIVDYFSQFKDDGLRGVDITPWIAYLEKQKEQNPALRLVGDGLVSDPNAHFELEGEQKPTELSEEERIRKDLISAIEASAQLCDCLARHGLDSEKVCSYLKKQKPAELSERDKEMLQDVYESLYAYQCDIRGDNNPDRELLTQVEKEKQWIKSLHERLRPQPHWKPSEEQMEWLKSAVRLSTDKPRIHGIIISLYEQLKSL